MAFSDPTPEQRVQAAYGAQLGVARMQQSGLPWYTVSVSGPMGCDETRGLYTEGAVNQDVVSENRAFRVREDPSEAFRQGTVTGMRLRLRLSQAALAAQLGVSPRTVSRWEKGETPVPQLAVLAVQGLLDAEDAAAAERCRRENVAHADEDLAQVRELLDEVASILTVLA